MRICLFNVTSTMDAIGSAEVGGVEAYTFRLGAALQERGHETVLFGGQPAAGRPFQASSLTVKLSPHIATSSIPNLGTRFRRLVQRLHFAKSAWREFMRERFDAVLIFKPYDLITARAWRLAGAKSRIIASIHGPEFYPSDRFFAGSADVMYAVSESTAKAVRERYRRACPVLPNFINLNRFPFLERPRAPDRKLVIAVGRMVGWKGMASLIQAFARVREAVPEARLALAGEGPEKPALMEMANQSGLASAVEFRGVLDEASVIALHRNAWLLVQPSVGYESFSISVLEAAASGVPAVVSDRVGIADWFRDRQAMEVFPAGDADSLADMLKRRLQEPWDANRQRARNARSVVEAEFASEKIVAEIEKLCIGDGPAIVSAEETE